MVTDNYLTICYSCFDFCAVDNVVYKGRVKIATRHGI